MAMLKVQNKSRLEKLIELEKTLANALDHCDDAKNISQLARQYRETIKEIEELQGKSDSNDELGEILSNRRAKGKAGAVRKNSTGL